MSCDLRFHRRKGFPEKLVLPTGTYPIEKTDHSKHRAHDNDHGSFALPDEIHFTKEHIIEVKIKDRRVWRILIRKEFDDQYDVCYVIQFPNFELITSWRNEKSDTHETLDLKQYNHPNEFQHYIQQTRD